MKLRSLCLKQFRCYSQSCFEFASGLNSIYGSNARGKTTVLEAIFFLIAGQSFRTSQLNDLIQIGQSNFYLEAIFEKNGIEQTIKVVNGKERKVQCNSTVYTSLSSLLGLLQGVVVAPDDVSLVKGAPQVRRRFLDLQTAQVNPLYVHHLIRYNRALQQRNALLRSQNRENINLWEQEMANSAAYLVQQRRQAIDELNKEIGHLYYSLSGETEKFTLTYKNSSPEQNNLREYYLNQFEKHRQKEYLLGFTLSGPHKDDVIIEIESKETRFYASEGQQRSAVLALQLAVWKRVKMISGVDPLFLIDDVGVSLDGNRKERLMESLHNLGQVFLTSTHPLSLRAHNIEL